MKKLLILLCLSNIANAQCLQSRTTTNTYNLSGSLTNYSFNGSYTINGNGVLQNSVNFNNWQNLIFSGTINIRQVINFGGFVQTSGNINMKDVSMNGNDTIFVQSGKVTIEELIANNQGNAIVLGSSSRVFIDGAEYFAGQQYCHVKILQNCNSPLPLVDYKFEAYNKSNVAYLRWNYKGDMEVQYSYDGKNWLSASRAYNKYEMKIDKNIFFKLVNGQDYSKVIPVRYIPQGKDIIYTVDGKQIDEIIVPGVYIINGVKIVK